MSKRNNALTTISIGSKYPKLYNDMRIAIAKCYAIDECKDIADKSAAMAAYYQQVKDTETERIVYRVKLRAWRRMGELFSAVDFSDCPTQSTKIKKIRANFDEAVVAKIGNARIANILKLTALSDNDFEFALKRITCGGMETLLQWHTPEAVARLERNFARQRREKEKERTPEYQKKLQQQLEREDMERRHVEELSEAVDEAFDEVGITLERKDRERMKQVVFLIKEEIHAVMRQAAFDQKITMQEILRRGLRMWLIAHDYDFPERETASARSGSTRSAARVSA
jgi:hypothetical protein